MKRQILRVQFVQLLITFVMSGCGPVGSTVDPPTDRPYRGQTLRVACGEGIDKTLVEQFARDWSREQGVAVEVGPLERGPRDIAVVRAADLPRLAESGDYLTVPSSVTDRDGAYQWESLTPLYSGLFPRWDGLTYGVPLLGEGFVMVYRTDRFEKDQLLPPQTWEDFVKVGARLGKGSLPPLPEQPAAFQTLFHQIAACYDRPAQQQSESVAVPDAETADRTFSYQYRLKTAEPRIDAPAFRHAFELLRQMQPYRSTEPNAFGTGEASLAIATLADVARYQRPGSPARGKFAVASLPGAAFTFDLQTGARVPNRAGAVNRVPYVGGESWMGMVSKKCTFPDAAWAFLVAFASPEKHGAEVIAAGRWGAGPYRSSQTEERGRGLWLGFDLPAEQTEKLVAIMKEHLATSLVNHRHPLRLPNSAEHTKRFVQIVRPAILDEKNGTDKALGEVAEAWRSLWKNVPEAERRRWLQEGEGL